MKSLNLQKNERKENRTRETYTLVGGLLLALGSAWVCIFILAYIVFTFPYDKDAEYTGGCYNEISRDEMQGRVEDDNWIFDEYCRRNCNWDDYVAGKEANLTCKYHKDW